MPPGTPPRPSVPTLYCDPLCGKLVVVQCSSSFFSSDYRGPHFPTSSLLPPPPLVMSNLMVQLEEPLFRSRAINIINIIIIIAVAADVCRSGVCKMWMVVWFPSTSHKLSICRNRVFGNRKCQIIRLRQNFLPNLAIIHSCRKFTMFIIPNKNNQLVPTQPILDFFPKYFQPLGPFQIIAILVKNILITLGMCLKVSTAV